MVGARDRQRPLKVYVSDEEREALAERARGAGLSVSTYLRRLGLGHEPKSRIDHASVMKLFKVNGDQGRLGGLLKLWLSERPGHGASAFDVRKLLREIEALQVELKDCIRELRGKAEL